MTKNIYDMSFAELLEDDLNSHSIERITDFILYKIEKLNKSIQEKHLKDPKNAANFYNFVVAAEKWLTKTDRSKKDELYLEVSNLVMLARITNKAARITSMFKKGKGKIDCFAFRRKAKSDYDENLIDDFLEESLASNKVHLYDTYSYEEWEEMFHEFE